MAYGSELFSRAVKICFEIVLVGSWQWRLNRSRMSCWENHIENYYDDGAKQNRAYALRISSNAPRYHVLICDQPVHLM